MALFIPTYFSPISQYAALVHAKEIIFEVNDNFQKQSYRNRCYIFNTNGRQLLNIPVKHAISSERKKTRDILLEKGSSWQIQHFKSLKTAYRNSPFFEFYIDDLAPIFEKKYIYLQDVNIDTFLFVFEALQIPSDFKRTTTYNLESANNDFRNLASAKLHPKKVVDSYIQMFDDKHGFIPNLSILDLLFMEGPNAISFLKKNV
jgi:hypothetical protein